MSKFDWRNFCIHIWEKYVHIITIFLEIKIIQIKEEKIFCEGQFFHTIFFIFANGVILKWMICKMNKLPATRCIILIGADIVKMRPNQVAGESKIQTFSWKTDGDTQAGGLLKMEETVHNKISLRYPKRFS